MINKYFKWKDKVVFLSDLVFAEGVWKFVVYDCSPNLTELNEALLWHPFQTKNTPYFINVEDFNYSDDLTATCSFSNPTGRLQQLMSDKNFCVG